MPTDLAMPLAPEAVPPCFSDHDRSFFEPESYACCQVLPSSSSHPVKTVMALQSRGSVR